MGSHGTELCKVLCFAFGQWPLEGLVTHRVFLIETQLSFGRATRVSGWPLLRLEWQLRLCHRQPVVELRKSNMQVVCLHVGRAGSGKAISPQEHRALVERRLLIGTCQLLLINIS